MSLQETGGSSVGQNAFEETPTVTPISLMRTWIDHRYAVDRNQPDQKTTSLELIQDLQFTAPDEQPPYSPLDKAYLSDGQGLHYITAGRQTIGGILFDKASIQAGFFALETINPSLVDIEGLHQRDAQDVSKRIGERLRQVADDAHSAKVDILRGIANGASDLLKARKALTHDPATSGLIATLSKGGGTLPEISLDIASVGIGQIITVHMSPLGNPLILRHVIPQDGFATLSANMMLAESLQAHRVSTQDNSSLLGSDKRIVASQWLSMDQPIQPLSLNVNLTRMTDYAHPTSKIIISPTPLFDLEDQTIATAVKRSATNTDLASALTQHLFERGISTSLATATIVV